MSPLALKLREEHKARLSRFGVSAVPNTPVVQYPPRPILPIEDYGRPSPVTSKSEARKVIQATADEYGLLADEIYSRQRNAKVVFARHVAIHRLHKRFPHWSYPQIGRSMGRDHTTIMYILGKLQNKPKRLAEVIAAA